MRLAGGDAGRSVVARVRLELEKSTGHSENQADNFGDNCNVDCFEPWHVEVDTVPT